MPREELRGRGEVAGVAVSGSAAKGGLKRCGRSDVSEVERNECSERCSQSLRSSRRETAKQEVLCRGSGIFVRF